MLAGIAYNNELLSSPVDKSTTCPTTNEFDRYLLLACETHEEAEKWVSAIEQTANCLATGRSYSQQQTNAQPLSHQINNDMKLASTEEWIKNSSWKVFSIKDGVRVLEINTNNKSSAPTSVSVGTSKTTASSPSSPSGPASPASSPSSADSGAALQSPPSLPCLRVDIGVPASPAETFSAVINLPSGCHTGCIRELCLLEQISSNCDVVHIVLQPVYTFPSWSSPRDFCLRRCWKETSDGGYIVCMDSTVHQDCPLQSGSVRSEMHAVYVISPSKVRTQTPMLSIKITLDKSICLFAGRRLR